MRHTFTRLISCGTRNSSSATLSTTSSYHTSTSTRRFRARPSSVAFEATGRVSPAHSKEIDSGGNASELWKCSATCPARSLDKPALSP